MQTHTRSHTDTQYRNTQLTHWKCLLCFSFQAYLKHVVRAVGQRKQCIVGLNMRNLTQCGANHDWLYFRVWFRPKKGIPSFPDATQVSTTDCVKVLQVLFYSILLNPLLNMLTKDRLIKISSLTCLISTHGEKCRMSQRSGSTWANTAKF